MSDHYINIFYRDEDGGYVAAMYGYARFLEILGEGVEQAESE